MSFPHPAPTKILARFSDIAQDYDAVFCDIWGVLHNGVASFPDAVAVLRHLRARKIPVILITNAPRPSPPIMAQLTELGVARDVYTDLVTSGDISMAMIAAFGAAPVYHIGPMRDHALFDMVHEQTGLMPPLTRLEEAAYCVCTGLFEDEHETPEDYRERLMLMCAKNMVMICGNPDIIVHRGAHEIYCAGALAALYTQLGGKVHYAGKPHAPIYQRALFLAKEALVQTNPALWQNDQSPKILAIGDALHTDVLGAKSQHHACLFIAGGIHAREFLSQGASHKTGTQAAIDALDGDKIAARLQAYCADHKIAKVDYVLSRLSV